MTGPRAPARPTPTRQRSLPRRARRLGRAALRVAAGALLALVIGLAVWLTTAYGGRLDVAADGPTPRGVVAWTITTAKRARIRREGGALRVPREDALRDPALLELGILHYRARCEGCHGGPGVAPHPLARRLSPPAPPLWERAPLTQRHAGRLRWVIEHGVGWSAMPAYGDVLSDRAQWALVAFLRRLRGMDPATYQAWAERAEARAHPEAVPLEPLPDDAPQSGRTCPDLFGPGGPPRGYGPP